MTAHRLVAAGLIGALSVAACQKPAEQPTDPVQPTVPAQQTAPTAPPIGYACESGQTVSVAYPDTATASLTYKAQTYSLRLVPSGTGARYTGNGVEWWIAAGDGQETAALSRLGPNDDVGVAVLERCSRPSNNPELPAPGTQQPQPTPAPGGVLPAAAPCTAGQLRLGSAGGDAGAGNRVGIVSVMNTGPAVCSLSGYPMLTLTDARGQAVPNLRVDQNPNTATPVNIAVNGRAYFDIAWNVIPNEGAGQRVCPSVANIGVKIGTATTSLPLAFQPCGFRVRVNPFRSTADGSATPAPVAASATT